MGGFEHTSSNVILPFAKHARRAAPTAALEWELSWHTIVRFKTFAMICAQTALFDPPPVSEIVSNCVPDACMAAFASANVKATPCNTALVKSDRPVASVMLEKAAGTY